MGEILREGDPIEGLLVEPRRQIGDHRGMVMHMLRRDWEHFAGCAEIYFSTVHQGVVKAWKKHLEMVQHFSVPVGEIEFILFDGREDSPTRGNLSRVVLGVERHGLLRIPARVWYGFRGLTQGDSLIVNAATVLHDPAEMVKLPEDDPSIPFRWRTSP